jgi:hypothetical protein
MTKRDSNGSTDRLRHESVRIARARMHSVAQMHARLERPRRTTELRTTRTPP